MAYVLKKMTKVEVPGERIFCETEAFPKQIMVSVAMSKAGKTSTFFVESSTKVNLICNALLREIIPEMYRLEKQVKSIGRGS